MVLKLIDIHAHVNFPQFDVDREAVIERARAAGIGMINVGTDLETSRGAVTLAENNEDMWATVGIHPTDLPASAEEEKILTELEKLARHGRVVAIGECGLDYSKFNPPAGEAGTQSEKEQLKEKNKQKEIFIKQIELAFKVGKPLMIHCRPSLGTQDAYEDLLQILNQKLEAGSQKLFGNVHFFVGDWPTAKKFLDLNFTLSFTSVLTFTHDYDEVVKNTPLDRIMIETDCPFVAPAPYRGKRNEPAYLPAIIESLAKIKGLTVDQVAQATLANSQRFFGLALS